MSVRRTIVGLICLACLIAATWLSGVAGPQDASVTILQPRSDQLLTGSAVLVQIEVEGVVLGGRSRNGAYALLTLDDMASVKSLAPRFRFRNVDPGDHELLVELRRPDGSRFDPAVEASVRFRTEAGS